MPPPAPTRPLSEVAIEIAQTCLRHLDHTDALADKAVVHEIRVATKRLRAAWHLVAEQAGTAHAKGRRRTLSGLSAKLAGTRELSVLTRLTLRLAAAVANDRGAAALNQVAIRLAQRHANAAHPGGNATDLYEDIREGLTAEIAAWRGLAHDDRPLRRRAVRRELGRSRRRARRDARKTAHRRDADLWHDWRKAVNRLRYQREFVAIAAGREPRKFDTRLRRLGWRLGKCHDLANLVKFAADLLAAGDLTTADHRLVGKAIAVVESGLIRRCRRLAKRVFLR
ncbi:MAG: CHAD domain-containing protein [Akkermansiaceae bacterium]|nr:CHAD domain-containing protein [Akkermansiaceae bacterium]